MEMKALKNDKCSKSNKTHPSHIGSHPVQRTDERNTKCLNYDIPQDMKHINNLLHEAHGHTTYNQSYTLKCNDSDLMQKDPNNSMSLQHVHYIKRCDEQKLLPPDLPKRLPHPIKIPSSEYQDKYIFVTDRPSKSVPTDIFLNLQSKITKEGRQQSLITNDCEGYTKYLDPYITTSQFDYRVYTQNELKKYNNKPFQTNALLTKRITPIYDEAIFKSKFYENIFKKLTKAVPHSGMESETKGSYRKPVNEMSFYICKGTKINTPPITNNIRGEILSTPFMYQSEYNNLERNSLLTQEAFTEQET